MEDQMCHIRSDVSHYIRCVYKYWIYMWTGLYTHLESVINCNTFMYTCRYSEGDLQIIDIDGETNSMSVLSRGIWSLCGFYIAMLSHDYHAVIYICIDMTDKRYILRISTTAQKKLMCVTLNTSGQLYSYM